MAYIDNRSAIRANAPTLSNFLEEVKPNIMKDLDARLADNPINSTGMNKINTPLIQGTQSQELAPDVLKVLQAKMGYSDAPVWKNNPQGFLDRVNDPNFHAGGPAPSQGNFNAQEWAQYAGRAYGINPQFLLEIGRRESGLKVDSVNDWDINAINGTPSKGIMQFIEPTFSGYSRNAQNANPNAWKGIGRNWLDPRAQMLAAAWAFSAGHGSAWATFDAARNTFPMTGARSASNRPTDGAGPVRSQSRLGGNTGALGSMQSSGPDPVAIEKLKQAFWSDPYRAAMEEIKYRKANPVTYQSSPGMDPSGQGAVQQGAGAGNIPGGRPIADDWRGIQRLGQSMFGLENDPGDNQTTGGSHTAGSEHYDGRAVDFGDARNTWAQLNQAMSWFQQQGYDVLNEGDHIHVSLPGSGT